MTECSICQSTIVDKVLMTCKYTHAFCFKCILKYVEQNGELKSCPNCRGGDKFIMVQSFDQSDNVGDQLDHVGDQSNQEDEFYTINFFRKSIPFLEKIIKTNFQNSCLISESSLLAFIRNKDQLKLVNVIISNSNEYSIENLSKLIKWSFYDRLSNRTNRPQTRPPYSDLDNSSSVETDLSNVLMNAMRSMYEYYPNDQNGPNDPNVDRHTGSFSTPLGTAMQATGARFALRRRIPGLRQERRAVLQHQIQDLIILINIKDVSINHLVDCRRKSNP